MSALSSPSEKAQKYLDVRALRLSRRQLFLGIGAAIVGLLPAKEVIVPADVIIQVCISNSKAFIASLDTAESPLVSGMFVREFTGTVYTDNLTS